MTAFEHYGGRHLSLSRTQHRSILEEAHRLRAEYLFLTVVWAELKVLSDPGSEDRESLPHWCHTAEGTFDRSTERDTFPGET